MIQPIFPRVAFAFIAAFLSAYAVAASVEPHTEIYRYHGLKLVTEGPSTDGIYQDFSHDNDNVGKMWGDADALTRGAERPSWVRSRVVRGVSMPFLRVEFSREGYGANIGITPKSRYPEVVPNNGHLHFEMRAASPVCVGVRIMERDGEIWGYGPAPLEYTMHCVGQNKGWTAFSVALNDPTSWFKFQYSGNVELGNARFDGDIVAALSFELGLGADGHLGPGTASLDVRDLHISASASPPNANLRAAADAGIQHP